MGIFSKRFLPLSFLSVFTCFIASPSLATLITFDAVSLGGDQYRYDYSVSNDDLAAPIEEFTIFFDPSLYATIGMTSAPAGWDPLVVQPDDILSDDGFFDVLALGAGIAQGGSLSGFSAIFTFLGIGAPGAQAFDIVDPVTFDILANGVTVAVEAPEIPLPGAAVLMLSGLGGLVFRARCKRNRSTT
jgi:hypothetical protein